MSLSDQKPLLIIAGAGRGIGFALVEEAFKNYPDFSIFAISKNITSLEKLKNKIGDRLIIASIDLSDLTSGDKIEILSKVSEYSVKGLVFTAGFLEKKNLGEINKELFLKTYLNNVWGFIDLLQTLQPDLKAGSHVVTIGSMGGIPVTQKFQGMSVYSSSKGALSIISECYAEELKEKGVSVNTLVIGAVNTEMMKTAFPDYTAPLNPGDITPFILDFTLRYGSLFNGKVIPVSLNTL